MTQCADEPQSTLCGGGSGCPRLGGVPGNFQVPGNLYQVPRWLVSSDWPLPLVLWDSHPLAVDTPSGASVPLLLGWACRCRRDVLPQVFGTVGATNGTVVLVHYLPLAPGGHYWGFPSSL